METNYWSINTVEVSRSDGIRWTAAVLNADKCTQVPSDASDKDRFFPVKTKKTHRSQSVTWNAEPTKYSEVVKRILQRIVSTSY